MTMAMSPDHLEEAKIMTSTKTMSSSIHGLWLLIEACQAAEGSGLTSDQN
jgi:hypothetical protein